MTISTVTTERLKKIASGNAFTCTQDDESASMAAELLAVREAKPLGFTHRSEISNMQATGLYLRAWPVDRRLNEQEGYTIPLYTAPAAPAVPDAITVDNAPEIFEIAAQVERIGLSGAYGAYASGWNACRAAMLAAAPTPTKAGE
ncbi:hypothetical protein [Serratia sp. JSRIV006]|uniref:hypothetical protein n=1 Tax=Serratia sp. JSRIV006 TaxID=2831896 RepID=UPI001CC11254|nr:hypothetical protein [Serratia sp. JSRIV006]UAN64251.1 hypothetical protein KGP16_06665 [Serratia sp. JSRIV006]